MSVDASVKIESGLFDIADKAALKIVDAAARELGFEMLRASQVYLERQVYTRPNDQVTADRVDEVIEPTGALINSGYVRTFTGELPPGCKNQEEAESSAKAKNPEVKFGQAPPGPSKLGQVQVLFASEYGLYIEMGTVTGMIARPYLGPAAQDVEAVAEEFILAKLREAGFE